MLKSGQRRNFNAAMKIALFFFFLVISVNAFSQDKTISGIVFEKESKERVASVSIHNISTGASVYNSLKGDFKIPALPGDVLVFSKANFFPDTVVINSPAELAVYITRKAIQLNPVTIRDTLLSPEKRLEATKQEFSKIYGSLGYHDLLSTSSGGAGLSIDALWNAISRSGRNAEHLQEIIQSDYQQNVIDYRFNRTLVGNLTGLKDDRLTDFMRRYRPGYYLTKTATDYEFASSIKSNLRRFLRSKRVYYQQPLVNKQ